MRPVAAWFRRMFRNFDSGTPAEPRPISSHGGAHGAGGMGGGAGGGDGNSRHDTNTMLSSVLLDDAFWNPTKDGELDSNFDWLTQQLDSLVG